MGIKAERNLMGKEGDNVVSRRVLKDEGKYKYI